MLGGFTLFVSGLMLFFQFSIPDSLRRGGSGVDSLRAAEEARIAAMNFERLNPFLVPDRQDLSQTALEDSVLRWRPFSDLYEWMYSQTGAVTYRQGSFGRYSAFEWDGVDWRGVHLNVEGLDYRNHLSEAAQLEFLPHFLLDRMSFNPASGELDFRMRRHSIVAPLTSAYYGQSAFGYQYLMGQHSQNISQKLNVNISGWGKDESGEFNQTILRGLMAHGSARYQFNRRWQGRLFVLYNNDRHDQANAFQIQQMSSFGFDRFRTRPVHLSGQSKQRDFHGRLELMWRPDTLGAEIFHAGIRRDRQEYEHRFSADSTQYGSEFWSAFASYALRFRGFELEPKVETGMLFNRGDRFDALDAGSVSITRLSSLVVYDFGKGSSVTGRAWNELRSDGEVSTDWSATASVKWGVLVLQPRFRARSKAPTLLQKKWSSLHFVGDEELNNESELLLAAKLGVHFGKVHRVELDGGLATVKDAISLSADSAFVNLPRFERLFGSLSYHLEAKKWEGMASATFSSYESSGTDLKSVLLSNSSERVWLRANLFYKSYVFKRAAFVRLGVENWFSPVAYRTPNFVPELGVWDFPLIADEVPGFYRLDGEVSARVRELLIQLRWENLLDDVGQLGYFETANNPMPRRRFILGVRWYIRN